MLLPENARLMTELGAPRWIRPPLREAAEAGATLDFETPGCVMRLANPDDWLSPLDASHEQTAQPVWVEHFDRPSEEP